MEINPREHSLVWLWLQKWCNAAPHIHSSTKVLVIKNILKGVMAFIQYNSLQHMYCPEGLLPSSINKEKFRNF